MLVLRSGSIYSITSIPPLNLRVLFFFQRQNGSLSRQYFCLLLHFIKWLFANPEMHLSVLCQNLASAFKTISYLISWANLTWQPTLFALLPIPIETEKSQQNFVSSFLAKNCMFSMMMSLTIVIWLHIWLGRSSDKLGSSTPFGGWYSAKWRNNSTWFRRWQPWEW